MTKQYDRQYFDHWYRSRETRVSSHGEVRRKVSLAVSLTEYFLRRPIRTVLDVGCGEAPWRTHLKALRPKVEYLGLDSSDYVVERFGKSRNVRKALFGDLPSLKLGVYDLVVCSDVMHYIQEDELRRGVEAIAAACDGLAYLEVLTREDDVVGDLNAFFRRPASWYRRLFTSAGLTFAGPYSWLSPAFADAVAELEAGK